MNNKYIFLRHGESVANQRDIICSSLKNGTSPEFGLTQLGIIQANYTSKVLKKELKKEDIIIFTSPYTRAVQTALIVKSTLGIDNNNFFVSMNLKERGFESKELKSSKEYAKVWENDKKGKDSRGIEPCLSVALRIEEFYLMLNAKYNNKTIILVSHGDTIMIARTLLLGVSFFSHRDYDFIKNAECLVFTS